MHRLISHVRHARLPRSIYVYRLVEFHDLEPRLTAALAARCHLAAADRDGGAAAVP